MIPVLETSRLALRAHRKEDLAASAAMWADPVVVRHIGGRSFSESETWHKLLRYAGLWELVGYGYWAVEEKASGEFIGELGFADFRREITPSISGIPELGWVLATRAHGQGYATEALHAVIAWADARFGWPRTVCIIDPGNVASIRVAQKCGYQEVVRTIFAGQPTVLFDRHSPAHGVRR